MLSREVEEKAHLLDAAFQVRLPTPFCELWRKVGEQPTWARMMPFDSYEPETLLAMANTSSQPGKRPFRLTSCYL
jgi:hypothetical protein